MNDYLPPQIELPSAAYGFKYICSSDSVYDVTSELWHVHFVAVQLVVSRITTYRE